jgi:hypothetical protein
MNKSKKSHFTLMAGRVIQFSVPVIAKGVGEAVKAIFKTEVKREAVKAVGRCVSQNEFGSQAERRGKDESKSKQGNTPNEESKPRSEKLCGIRDMSNTRKEAREKAKQKSDKDKKPIGPEKHKDGFPHYHPNVPDNDPKRHDHYNFPPGKF